MQTCESGNNADPCGLPSCPQCSKLFDRADALHDEAKESAEPDAMDAEEPFAFRRETGRTDAPRQSGR